MLNPDERQQIKIFTEGSARTESFFDRTLRNYFGAHCEICSRLHCEICDGMRAAIRLTDRLFSTTK